LTTVTWELSEPPFTGDDAVIGPGATGSFTGLDGTTITIHDLNSGTEPVGTAFADQPFIAFNAAPGDPLLDINFILPGIYNATNCATLPPAVGQNCTIGPTSPFSFVNNPPPSPAGPQATASFVFTGETSDGQSDWTGNFTSQFSIPYQQVLAAFAPGGSGSVSNTFSATITVSPVVRSAPLPEPGPMALAGCGLGLVFFSAALRRSGQRKQN
jgi:hypothetical protein